MKKSLIIYNLFPRHYKNIHDWFIEIPRIKSMGFNAIYVNPFFETGNSKSLYAIRDYYKINKEFLNHNEDPKDFSIIKNFSEECKKYDIDLFIDLVINHTANESILVNSHSEWYKWENGNLVHPFALDENNNKIVWGDLATIDNNINRNNLWDYWDSLIEFFQNLGINGFRCDAAYQVSADLWYYLISNAKYRNGSTTFLAETLGCLQDQINALYKCGFDYLFNSIKYWNYDNNWAIDQHKNNRNIAPSIAFPESHDTTRLANDWPNTEFVQKGRYAFASIFSKGLMILNGFEFGSTVKAHVVNGKKEDLNRKWDISEWISKINNLKVVIPVLSEEGYWDVLSDYNKSYLFLKKSSDFGNKSIYVCVNKQWFDNYYIKEWMIPDEIKRNSNKMIQLVNFTESHIRYEFDMLPLDVVLFLE